MKALLFTVTLSVPWVQSLKDKRMVVKSLKDRLARRNLAVLESGMTEQRQRAELSVVALAANQALADAIYEDTMRFIEENCPAPVIDVTRQQLL